ncbi:hypothetical protein BVRB_4g079590 [Beta vulgaris subsp. vulgaris]|nr:hypothetical protein BVRB_4g079590 [Beta vulgaris subsp. vulgaris]
MLTNTAPNRETELTVLQENLKVSTPITTSMLNKLMKKVFLHFSIDSQQHESKFQSIPSFPPTARSPSMLNKFITILFFYITPALCFVLRCTKIDSLLSISYPPPLNHKFIYRKKSKKRGRGK